MKVLVVDDEENVRKGIATFLSLSGYEAGEASNLAAARRALAEESFGAALVDLYIGTEYGAELLDDANRSPSRSRVIMMSGKGSVKDAVDAVRRGAYDFIEKPLDTDRLLATLRNLERESATEARLEAFRSSWLGEHVYIEAGSELAEAFDAARRTAASPLSVLVTGPTGSGKELAARWIHLSSPRSQGPFVAVNCAAIPEELAESEFFGSRKGAFTGSVADRSGYFEAASGGTLFLDEVGELPVALQSSLLRAVESGEIQSVGASGAKRVDLRIVAATNRDLRAEIKASRFREDLYWRLAQSTVDLPSLDSRRNEIRGLSLFLAEPIRAQMGKDAPRLSFEALCYLESRPWPGNVRELRAFIERALWLAPRAADIGSDYLAAIENASAAKDAHEEAARPAGLVSDMLSFTPEKSMASAKLSLAEAKKNFERFYIEAALEEAGGSVAKAAQRLALLPNNLSRKLKELGIR
jgi:DNA-binding NtrC family response regulator